MSVDRMTRLNALLRREIAEALFEVINEDAFDPAAVTITAVEAARSLREARVKVSVRGDEAHKHAMLALLRRHRGRMQELINRDMTLKYTPRLSFELDRSVEKGDHMLDVLRTLEQEPAAPPAEDPGEPRA